MDTKIVQRLAEIMARHGLSELEIEEAGARVHLCRGGVVAPSAPVVASAPVAAVSEAPASESSSAAASASSASVSASATTITSPLVGTFYTASSPEAEPFVHEGSVVTAGTTVCIIEAMKTMNTIESPCDGKVQKILVTNGELVEYHQPLIVIE